jgi:hypothetical protein
MTGIGGIGAMDLESRFADVALHGRQLRLRRRSVLDVELGRGGHK